MLPSQSEMLRDFTPVFEIELAQQSFAHIKHVMTYLPVFHYHLFLPDFLHDQNIRQRPAYVHSSDNGKDGILSASQTLFHIQLCIFTIRMTKIRFSFKYKMPEAYKSDINQKNRFPVPTQGA